MNVYFLKRHVHVDSTFEMTIETMNVVTSAVFLVKAVVPVERNMMVVFGLAGCCRQAHPEAKLLSRCTRVLTTRTHLLRTHRPFVSSLF